MQKSDYLREFYRKLNPYIMMSTKSYSGDQSTDSSNSEKSKDDNNGNVVQIKLPPAPTACCMSGCANCVWIQYADDVIKLYEDHGQKADRKLILKQIDDPYMKAFLDMELRMKVRDMK